MCVGLCTLRASRKLEASVVDIARAPHRAAIRTIDWATSAWSSRTKSSGPPWIPPLRRRGKAPSTVAGLKREVIGESSRVLCGGWSGGESAIAALRNSGGLQVRRYAQSPRQRRNLQALKYLRHEQASAVPARGTSESNSTKPLCRCSPAWPSPYKIPARAPSHSGKLLANKVSSSVDFDDQPVGKRCKYAACCKNCVGVGFCGHSRDFKDQRLSVGNRDSRQKVKQRTSILVELQVSCSLQVQRAG